MPQEITRERNFMARNWSGSPLWVLESSDGGGPLMSMGRIMYYATQERAQDAARKVNAALANVDAEKKRRES